MNSQRHATTRIEHRKALEMNRMEKAYPSIVMVSLLLLAAWGDARVMFVASVIGLIAGIFIFTWKSGADG